MIDDDIKKEEVARRLNHSVRWLQAIFAKDRKANYPPKLQFHHYIGRIPLWTDSEFPSLKAALVAVADARHGRSERPAQPLSSAAVSGTSTVRYAKGPPRGLSRGQAAEYIGEGATKFDEMVDDGRKPKPHRIDRRVCRGIGYDWIKLTLIERPSE